MIEQPLLPATSTDAAGRALRHDGWTADRQRLFLERIADDDTVKQATRQVGMTVASVYSFRRRAAGAAFALGWRAANLLARDRFADELTVRALEGQVDVVTRADGSQIERHRLDNRLALSLLARLDRMADATDATTAADHHAARLVAQDFDAYLDLVEADAGPARAGLFLACRSGHAGDPAQAALEPVLALARADLYARTRAADASDIAIDDLDPARRAEWTAEQWARAEAAGLLRLAAAPPPMAPCEQAPLPPLVSDKPVWWDQEANEWRTRFPAPAKDADLCAEEGDYGDPDYARSLTPDEEAVLDAERESFFAEQRAAESAERDRWFAGVRLAIEEAEAEADAAAAQPDAQPDEARDDAPGVDAPAVPSPDAVQPFPPRND